MRQPGEIIWRDVPEYEGNYIISNTGIIMSLCSRWGKRKQNRPVSQSLVGRNRALYWGVNLYSGGALKRLLVHRLLALAFIPNPCNKPHINHIDSNRLNNSLDNLEWVTRRENISHYFKGIRNHATGTSFLKNAVNGKKWAAKVSVDNKTKTIGLFNTMQEASNAYKNFLLERNEVNLYA